MHRAVAHNDLNDVDDDNYGDGDDDNDNYEGDDDNYDDGERFITAHTLWCTL